MARFVKCLGKNKGKHPQFDLTKDKNAKKILKKQF